MKTKLIAAAVLMMASGAAHAGSCEDMVDQYNREAAPNDKIAKDSKWGCIPGGSFYQIDKALRDNKEKCANDPEYRDYQATHPKWKGCEPFQFPKGG
jgi:hypothetical protein